MLKITGLWKSTSKAGTAYYSGKVGNTRFMIFKNTKREGRDTDPDLTLHIAKVDDAEPWTEVVPVDGEDNLAPAGRQPAGNYRPSTPSAGAKRAVLEGHAPAAGQGGEPNFDDLDDSIPF